MQTIPALPVRNMLDAVSLYRDRLGFEVLRHDGGFAVLCRESGEGKRSNPATAAS